MKSLLFVIQNKRVALWRYEDVGFSNATIEGATDRPFNSEYWEAWVNEYKDSLKNGKATASTFDVLFLSDDASFKIPLIFEVDNKGKSSGVWTSDKFREICRSLMPPKDTIQEDTIHIVRGGDCSQLPVLTIRGSSWDKKVKTFYMFSNLKLNQPLENPWYGDCYCDEKAGQLKDGDKILGRVVVFSKERDRCYLVSESTSDYIRLKIHKAPKSQPSHMKVGDFVDLEKISSKENSVFFEVIKWRSL